MSRAVNRDDARPLRSVVFAPGDDADALAAPRRPAPTPWSSTSRSRRRRSRSASASAGARWRASSSTRWCPASCRSCSRGCSRRRRARRSRTSRAVAGPGAGRRSCSPRSRARPTCTRPTRCSRCTEVDFGSAARTARDLPDPRDRAGDPARLRDRDRVAAGVAHGRRAVALRRHPPGARVPLDRGGRGDALPALEGARRRQGRRDPLPDQRDVGRRARRPRRAARLRHRAAQPRVLRDDARRARSTCRSCTRCSPRPPRRSPTGRSSTSWRARPNAIGSGPIRHGDPRQGEAHVVHIAHVGSARKNLAWARDLGMG